MILKASIENYKSIKFQEITLDKFNTIVGRNGAGKTNFISAIRLLKELASGADLNATINARFAPIVTELFHLPNHKYEASFSFVVLTKQNNKYKFTYSVAYSRIQGGFRLSIPREELVRIENGVERSIYRRDRDTVYAGEPQEIIPFKVEANKLMLSVYAADEAIEVATTLKSYVFLGSGLSEQSGLDIIPANRPDLNTMDGVAVALYIKNHGRFDAATKSIQKILPDFVAPNVTAIEDQNPESTKVEKEPGNAKLYFVTWREKLFQDTFSHASLSHGDRRVIHLLFSLFNTDENTFFAVEEIENGMHYARLARLIDEFKTQARNRKIQVVFSTHSTEILKNLTVDEVIFCKKEPEKGTQLIRVSETELYNTIKTDLEENHTAADVMQGGFSW